jgi:acetyltransferase
VRGAGDLLASHPQITEIDLNPVLAGPDGALAVDWKIAVGDDGAKVGRRP